MGLLIFLGVLVGGMIVLLLIIRLSAPARRGTTIPMVRIAIAATSPEADMWARRLHAAGIGCQIQDFTGSAPAGTFYPNAYNAELWVREKDPDAARVVLGLRD